MTHTEKMEKLELIFRTCLDTLEKKGRDYSGTVDAMSNFKDFGYVGILVRIGDKYHRLKNLVKQNAAVSDEAVEDTLMDMLNYCALALVQKETEDYERRKLETT